MNTRKESLLELLEKIKKAEPNSITQFIEENERGFEKIKNSSKENPSMEEIMIFQVIAMEQKWKIYEFIEKWENGSFSPNPEEKEILVNLYPILKADNESTNGYEANEDFKKMNEEDKKFTLKRIEKLKKWEPALKKLLEKNGLFPSSSETSSSIINSKEQQNSLPSEPSPNIENSSPDPKPKNYALIVTISLVVLVMIIIGLAIFIPYLKSKKAKKVSKEEINLSKIDDNNDIKQSDKEEKDKELAKKAKSKKQSLSRKRKKIT